jgi:hypothetical protein
MRDSNCKTRRLFARSVAVVLNVKFLAREPAARRFFRGRDILPMIAGHRAVYNARRDWKHTSLFSSKRESDTEPATARENTRPTVRMARFLDFSPTQNRNQFAPPRVEPACLFGSHTVAGNGGPRRANCRG